jgi:hypothetical protein
MRRKEIKEIQTKALMVQIHRQRELSCLKAPEGR